MKGATKWPQIVLHHYLCMRYHHSLCWLRNYFRSKFTHLWNTAQCYAIWRSLYIKLHRWLEFVKPNRSCSKHNNMALQLVGKNLNNNSNYNILDIIFILSNVKDSVSLTTSWHNASAFTRATWILMSIGASFIRLNKYFIFHMVILEFLINIHFQIKILKISAGRIYTFLCRKWSKSLLKLCRNEKLPCNLTTGSTDATCVNSVIEQIDGGQRTCLCNVDCEELDYELSISQAIWPSRQYEVIAQDIWYTRNLLSVMSLL